MELHHSKHHQTYVTGLNAAEESYGKATTTGEKISLQAALKFNGGGEFYRLGSTLTAFTCLTAFIGVPKYNT
jgi:superoxide dismutase